MKKLLYILAISFLVLVVYLIFPFFNLFINKEKKEILSDTNKVILKIQEDLSFSEIGDYLVSKDLLLSSKIINQLIEFKNYENNILKKGKYTIQTKWSTNKLVNQLAAAQTTDDCDAIYKSNADLMKRLNKSEVAEIKRSFTNARSRIASQQKQAA